MGETKILFEIVGLFTKILKRIDEESIKAFEQSGNNGTAKSIGLDKAYSMIKSILEFEYPELFKLIQWRNET